MKKYQSIAASLLILAVGSAEAGRVYVNPHFPITGKGSEGRTTLSPPVISAVDSCSTYVYVQSCRQ